MPKVLGLCPLCGEEVEVDDSRETALCPHCKEAYVTERAVNAWRLEYPEEVQAIQNGEDAVSSDFIIRNGTLTHYRGEQEYVVIPHRVRVIGDNAFKHNTQLVGVEIPHGVHSIYAGAFQDCTRLESVTIPDGVEAVGNNAFQGCTRLESVNIPASVKAIWSGAFQGCTRLIEVELPSSVVEIGPHAFQGCIRLRHVLLPGSLRKIGKAAFQGCTNLASVTVPEGVTVIPWGAFCDCKSVEEINLPDSLRIIEARAFDDNDKVEEVVIPESVEMIQRDAFGECNKLKTVIIRSGKTKAEANAFSNCLTLSRFHAPRGWKGRNWSAAACLQRYKPLLKYVGCYIATAVYGSYDCPPVWTLRRFRDETLAASLPGRALIEAYYRISPLLLRLFGKQRWFRTLWRFWLDRLTARLRRNGVPDTPYDDPEY